MAIQGFDNDDYSAPMAEINTTPLVDVMLVLLVIFLVTAPMFTQSIQLELPNEEASERVDENAIAISLSQEGLYYWDTTLVTEAELKQRLQNAAFAHKAQPIHLYADMQVEYGKVSRLLALAQHYGLNNIGFVTQPQH